MAGMRIIPYALTLPLLAAPGCILETDCADGHCATSATTSTTGGATEPPTSSTEPPTTGATDSGSTGDTGGVAAIPTRYSNACAPNDGAAVEFTIGVDMRTCDSVIPEDAATFSIAIYQGFDLPVGTHMIGAAYLDTGDGMPQTSTTGSLTVTAKTADGLLGTYDVTFPDNTHLTGNIDAILCIVDILCG